MVPMSSVALWWLTVKGPQKLAQASPLSRYELANATVLSAENPLPTWQASPIRLFVTLAPSVMLAPGCTMQFSIMQSLPMYMLACCCPARVQSASLAAPFISQSSPTDMFTSSFVLMILAPIPMVVCLGLACSPYSMVMPLIVSKRL